MTPRIGLSIKDTYPWVTPPGGSLDFDVQIAGDYMEYLRYLPDTTFAVELSGPPELELRMIGPATLVLFDISRGRVTVGVSAPAGRYTIQAAATGNHGTRLTGQAELMVRAP